MNKQADYKCIALSIFDAMNSGDFTKFQENTMEDICLDFPGADRIEGAKRLILFFKVLLRKYRNLKFDIKDVIVEDDLLEAIKEKNLRVALDVFKGR